MRLAISMLAASMALFAAGAAAAADVALIIQNDRYLTRGQIRDFGSRANEHVAAYRAAGFEVIDLQNATAEAMRQGLRAFEAQSRDADRVVIDFTGHTVANGKTLFIMPVDASNGSIVERYYDSASLDLLYNLVRHRPARAVVVIASPNGRAPSHVDSGPAIPQGVTVLAGPTGDVRRTVTDRLLRGTATDRLASGNVWSGGFLSGMTFDAAVPVAEPVAEPQAPRTPPANSAVLTEMADWRAAAGAGTEAALQGYLQKYPNGIFAREARARLDELVPAEQRIEAALNLGRTERRNIQSQLTALGFDTRGIDGIWGAGTRRAIEEWQGSQGLRRTGYMDGAQIRILERQAADRQAEIERQREAEERAAQQADLTYWQRTGAGGDEAGLRAYLERYPEGLFAPQATRLLAEIEAAKPKNDPFAEYAAIEESLGLTPQMRMLAEQRLQARGLDTGRVDGNFDDATRSALRKFQRSTGLKVTGYLNRETVAVLIVSSFR